MKHIPFLIIIALFAFSFWVFVKYSEFAGTIGFVMALLLAAVIESSNTEEKRTEWYKGLKDKDKPFSN